MMRSWVSCGGKGIGWIYLRVRMWMFGLSLFCEVFCVCVIACVVCRGVRRQLGWVLGLELNSTWF